MKKEAPVTKLQESTGEEESKKIEQLKEASDSEGEEKKEQIEEEEKKEEQIPKEEMDGRVLEAFYRSLIETVKDEDLPLEPSHYLRDYFSEFACDEFQISLKGSSYKKIGKLLESAAADGLIKYEMTK